MKASSFGGFVLVISAVIYFVAHYQFNIGPKTAADLKELAVIYAVIGIFFIAIPARRKGRLIFFGLCGIVFFVWAFVKICSPVAFGAPWLMGAGIVFFILACREKYGY